MPITMNTICLITDEIKRLGRLHCFGCSGGYPDHNWLHSFGCQGCCFFIINVWFDEALSNLSVEDIVVTEIEREHLKTLIAINFY